MGKKDNHHQHQQREKAGKVESVLEILRKQCPLTLKQEKFCDSDCVERFLKSKGENAKKAAKQLRSCLSWRDSIGIENLMADEFSAELAEGVSYVAGHDDESRPVMVIRIKQDYQKFHSQKLFSRLLVFTVEVAIQTMSENTSDQFVVLFDGSYFRSASAFMNLLMPALKIMAEYYPGRLYRAYVIDPPSFFSYLWKGVRPFVELSSLTMTIASSEFHDMAFNAFGDTSGGYLRDSSLRFKPPSSSVQSWSTKIGPCASSRFSFTVSHHFDSLKPWYLSLTDASSARVGPTAAASTTTNHPAFSSPLGPALISPVNARSFSFASPSARRITTASGDRLARKSFIPSTPMPEKTYNADAAGAPLPRTPRPSFLHSPAEALFRGRKEAASRGAGKAERCREAFSPYLTFYRRPYDEMAYRAKMKPPLGGLISIVAPHQQLRRRHVSVSQRY
ncbi:hypothetical protein Dimus_001630 [Dionaea muscipula]